jgi:hypothetical protein
VVILYTLIRMPKSRVSKALPSPSCPLGIIGA